MQKATTTTPITRSTTANNKDPSLMLLCMLMQQIQNDSTWATQQIVFYLDYHKQRVLNRKHKEGHITAGTLHTLYQPIKTFSDAYPDVSTKINWKRILRSLPRVKTFPNDIELILLGVPFVPKLLKYHSYNHNY